MKTRNGNLCLLFSQINMLEIFAEIMNDRSDLFKYVKSLLPNFEFLSLTKLNYDSINALYRLKSHDNSTLIIKIMIRKPNDSIESKRFKKPLLISKKASNLPIPSILYYESKEVTLDDVKQYSMLIMAEVKGEALDNIWTDLSANEKQDFVKQFAKLIKRMSGINFSDVSITRSAYPDWNDFVIKKSEMAVQSLIPQKVIDPEILKKALTFIKTKEADWRFKGALSLIHGDLWQGNLLLDSNTMTIAAILDWEWSLAGDPLYDLTWVDDTILKQDETLISLFYDELRLVRDEHFNFKIDIYTIVQYLDTTAFGWVHHNPSKEGFENAENKINAILKKY